MSALKTNTVHFFTVRAEKFKLHARTKHVLAESLRVLAFKAQCTKGSSDTASIYAELGRIMHDSQLSLFHDYENGCPELEQVCSITKAHGALGSRPTGAGWGGSTVSLVEQSKVKEVLDALHSQYYKKRNPDITKEEFADAVLVSQPAAGACLYQV
jgi:galactokinase